MADKTATKQRARAAAPKNITLSRSTLDLAHQALSRVPAGNGAQAVALANALMEIEAMMGAMPNKPAPEEKPADDSK